MAAALGTLSTVANVFAIVDMAGTMLQAGTQLFDLYGRYRNLSTSVPRLLDEIKIATSSIAYARIFLQNFEVSALVVDHEQSLPQIERLLAVFDQEFRLLKELSPQHVQLSAHAGWLTRFRQYTGSFRLVLQEPKLEASCQRLHRFSGYMNNVLSLTGRRVPCLVSRFYHADIIQEKRHQCPPGTRRYTY